MKRNSIPVLTLPRRLLPLHPPDCWTNRVAVIAASRLFPADPPVFPGESGFRGFRDPRPDLRRIGTTRPEIVLIAEKTSLEWGVQLIAERFGVSTLILGGLPSLLSTEFFAKELKRNFDGPLRLISYVDFDPGGWIAAAGFQKQLLRFGVPSSGLEHLVVPARFTPEELDLYSIQLPTPTPEVADKVKAWLQLSGGIGGQARGLHADHLRPIERVAEAFANLTKSLAGNPPSQANSPSC